MTEKIIWSGNVLETFWYSNPVEINSVNLKHNKRTSVNKSVEFRRLVNANSGQWWDERTCEPYVTKFLTLTFADNVQDMKVANREFMLFIKRLTYVFRPREKFCYVAVPEFQKRGAIHYHILFFNLPYIQGAYEKLVRLWPHGFLQFKAIRDESEVGWYMAKYMYKSMRDKRMRGQKRYFSSRNVLRPVVIYDIGTIARFMSEVDSSPIYQSTFQIKGGGECRYQIFDISGTPMSFIHGEDILVDDRVDSEDEVVEVVDNSVHNWLF